MKYLILILFLTIYNCDEDSAPKHPMQGGGGAAPIILTNKFCESKFEEIHYRIGEHSGIADSVNNIKGKIDERCGSSNGRWVSHNNGREFQFLFPKNYGNDCDEPEYIIEMLSCDYIEMEFPAFKISNSFSNEILEYACKSDISEGIIELDCSELLKD